MKTLGPYDSKKAAMRANCQMGMNGSFYAGRAIRIDGKILMTTACRAYQTYRDGEPMWVADIEVRPLTDDERAAYDAAQAQRAEHARLVARSQEW
jgi:ABC-type phosphonate transport system ATPase subunit